MDKMCDLPGIHWDEEFEFFQDSVEAENITSLIRQTIRARTLVPFRSYGITEGPELRVIVSFPDDLVNGEIITINGEEIDSLASSSDHQR